MSKKIYIFFLSCLFSLAYLGSNCTFAQNGSSLKDYFASQDSGLYIFADSQNPSIIHFELLANDNITLKGSFNKQSGEIEAFADIKEFDASAFVPKLKEFYIKKAELTVKNNILTIKDSRFIYKGFPFALTATLQDLKSPLITLKLTGELLYLDLKGEYADQILKINNLTAKAGNSQIISTATLNLKDKTSQAKGKGFFYISDAQKMLTAFGQDFSTFNNINSQKPIEINFIAKNWDDLDNLQAEINTFIQNLNIYGLEAKNISAYVLRKGKSLIIDSLLAEIANGTLNCKAKINTLDNSAQANISLNEIYIEDIVRQLDLKKKTSSGKMSLKSSVENIALNSLDKMRGRGNISIIEGNIWQIDFLKGLGQFLSIPDFEEIIFSNGYSDFVLSGDKINFENLKLTSEQMSISGQGSLSTKGNLNFLLSPEFNEELIGSSEGLQKYIGAFFRKSGLAIEITGTTKNPRYKVRPVVIEPLKEIKGIFEELLRP